MRLCRPLDSAFNVSQVGAEPEPRTNSRRSVAMPRGKHLKGVSDKEQRKYEHIKESAEESGRYGKRAEEVAARTVLKQHKQAGHDPGE
jgi:hypothetical protein